MEIPGIQELAEVRKFRIVNRFKRQVYDDDGIWYCEQAPKPWCISYGHRDRKFSSLQAALRYALEEKFISADMISNIETAVTKYLEGVIKMIVFDQNGKVDEDKLEWTEVDATPERIAEIFRDKQILKCEMIDAPVTDGLVFVLTDLSQVMFVEVSVSDDLLRAGPDECVGMPLVVKVSEGIPVQHPDVDSSCSDGLAVGVFSSDNAV